MAVSEFELVDDRRIQEFATRAKIFRHRRTGARVLSLENADENKVFGISFATPPNDATGVPHILEHSVFCGSRRYPVKEPFVELMKGSLNTFLNAMTFPDKTCYPIASPNLKDFYNLIEVYLDAVFHPRLARETFLQEGWHFELDRADGPISIKGVVFNEMKGVYSSPESRLHTYARTTLFPGGPYGVDSGGDPARIPDLTYENFVAFHRRHYHPSNAFVFFCGDDDPDRRLEVLAEHFAGFEAEPIRVSVPLQSPFSEPRTFTFGYDAGELNEEDGDRHTFVMLNWVVGESTDAADTLALHVLSHVLMGTAASPLRKALVDSGLGEDVVGGSCDDDLRQVVFSAGLKGLARGDAARAEQLVLDTLATLAREGIDREVLEASMNTLEFRMREMNTGSYPRGLILMFGALSSWLHDGDPVEAIAFERPMAQLRTRMAADARLFESLIEARLLRNPYRSTVILSPDPSAKEREEAVERRRLEAADAALRPADREELARQTERLKLLQETPDPPEALATIPALHLGDVERKIKRVPSEIERIGEETVLVHDLPTNGILYLDLGFDLRVLEPRQLPWVLLFGRALLGHGTTKEDFVKLSRRIGRDTGGIRTALFLSSRVEETGLGADLPRVGAGADDVASWMFLRGKATLEKLPRLIDVLRDVLLEARLDNPERFRQIVLEEKSGEEAGLVPGGSSVVASRLRSRLAKSDWAGEKIRGLDYLFFLRELAERVQSDWPGVLAELEAIRSALLRRGAMLANVTVDAAGWSASRGAVMDLVGSLPAGRAVAQDWSPQLGAGSEGWTAPTQVNFVAKGASLTALGYQPHASILVASHLLGTGWLWERVRVQGGAYGASCSFDRRSGIFAFGSYRDPNLLRTLEIYDGSGRWLRELQLDARELEKAVIGVIGDLDAYQLPDAKGYTAMLRYLLGETDTTRQRIRDEVLATELRHVHEVGEALEAIRDHGAVVALGAEETLRAANEQLAARLEVRKAL